MNSFLLLNHGNSENELCNKNLLVKPNTSTNKFEQISRNNKHTAVTNITRQRMLEKKL